LIRHRDAAGMSIVVRRGRPVAEPRSRLLRFDRPSPATSSIVAIDDHPVAVDPRHELARLALDLVVRTAEPIDLPARWRTPAFAREVDRTRAQLVPIRSRAALLASFSREASVAVTRTSAITDHAPGPIRVAYAIRWLELGDGRARPDWPAFTAGAVRDLVASAAAVLELTGPRSSIHRKGDRTT
jgi:hypothetical protein